MNIKVALGLIKDDILIILDKKELDTKRCEKLITNISKNKVAVIPHRTFIRHKQKRSKRKFFMHQRDGV